MNHLRPIHLLLFASKLFECLVYNRMSCYPTNNNLLDLLQAGFHPKQSTDTELLKLTIDLLTAKSNSRYSILILLDLSAAFDVYLSCRTFSVTSINSSPLCLSAGVPKSSVLRFLLFFLYTYCLGQLITSQRL